MDQHARLAADAAAAAAAFGSFFGWFFGLLPVLLSVLASLMSICWLGIQIYEWRRRKLQDSAQPPYVAHD